MQEFNSTFWLLIVVTACGCQAEVSSPENDTSPQAKLNKTPTWVLQKMTVGGVPSKPLPASKPTISFQAGEMRGRTPCNSFSGDYTAKADGTFRNEGMNVTEMACDHMQLETDFLTVLSKANHFVVKTGVLVLSDGTPENSLTFIPHRPHAFPLRGTKWMLTHFSESDADSESATSVLRDHAIDLQISAERASGSAGCNQFHCDVKIIEGGRLNFVQLASTKKLCADEVMRQEDRLFGTLPKMTRYTIRENILQLSSEEGNLGLQFEGIEIDDQ